MSAWKRNLAANPVSGKENSYPLPMRPFPASSTLLLKQYLLLLILLLLSLNLYATAKHSDFETLLETVGSAPDQVLQQGKILLQQARADNDSLSQLLALNLIVTSNFALGDRSQAAVFIDLGLSLAIETGNKEQQVNFLVHKAELLTLQGQGIAALETINPAISLAKALKDNNLLANSLAIRGRVLMDQGLGLVALEDQLSALSLYKKSANPDTRAIGDLYNDISISYMDTGNYDEAIKLLHKTVAITDKDDLSSRSVNQHNLGVAYIELQRYEEAKKHLQKAKILATKINDQYGLAALASVYGKIYLTQQQPQQAINYFEQAMTLVDQLALPISKANNLLALADANIQMGHLDEAEHFQKQASALIKTLDTPSLRTDELAIQIELEAGRQNYKQAYQLLKKKDGLKNSQSEKEKQKQIQLLHVRFDSALKESENQLLKQTAKNQLERMYFMMGAAALIILIVVAAYLRELKLKRKMALLALQDDLTGVANRRHITQILQQEIDRARRYEHSLSIAMVDLDHFKRINDQYGHDKGDEVLKHFANISQDAIRSQDQFGRIGGEEWLFVFPHAQTAEAKQILVRLAQRYRDTLLPGLSAAEPLTFSAGITQLTPDDQHKEILMQRADRALYQAKDQGRDSILINP